MIKQSYVLYTLYLLKLKVLLSGQFVHKNLTNSFNMDKEGEEDKKNNRWQMVWVKVESFLYYAFC